LPSSHPTATAEADPSRSSRISALDSIAQPNPPQPQSIQKHKPNTR
jgi:hypothetical protein